MKMSGRSWSDDQVEVLTKALEDLAAWRFHAAHEKFEAAWRAANEPQRTWLHGLAQLAASYYQLTLGRGTAALRTWTKARAKLDTLPLDAFSTRLDALHQSLGLTPEGPRFIDPEQLRAHSLPMPSLEMLQPASE